MATNNYRIRITKPDFEFEVEGDKAFVLDILNRFERQTPRASQTEIQSGTNNKTKRELASKRLSLGEFVRQLGIKKHTDIVLAFGYYLEEHSGVKEFTAADINNCYYEAKMDSSNTSQMITRNIKSGRIMPAKTGKGKKAKKSYTLTVTGEDFIKNQLATAEQ